MVSRALPYQNYLPYVFAVFAFLLILVLYAQPMTDNDLWWQMAYGRSIIEHQSLILDHAEFSWSPVNSDAIYNAWIAQLSLLGMYKIGGLDLLFAFRYGCYFFVVLLVIQVAKKLDLLYKPVIWIMPILLIPMSQSAKYIKPELFSFVLFPIMVSVWIYLKVHGESKWKYCYLFPTILLFWVNSHGGFIFGCFFLGLMCVGELLNFYLSPKNALDRLVLKHLLWSACLSVLVLSMTPFGLDYPLLLAEKFLLELQQAGSKDNFQNIYAYKNIFSESTIGLRLVEYLVISLVALACFFLLAIRTQKVDFAILLTNIFFILLYVFVVRTAYFYPSLFSLTSIYLIYKNKEFEIYQPKIIQVLVVVAICFFVGYRSISSNLLHQPDDGYLGFGIGNQSPVSEAEFIKSLPAALKIGNDYTSGGYLVWAVWPRQSLIDSRYFPFMDWIDKYWDFMNGINVDEFLALYPADIWLLPHGVVVDEMFFRNSEEWHLAFYGITAAVYVKKDVSNLETRVAGGIGDIKNVNKAIHFIKYAAEIGDFESAYLAINGINNNTILSQHEKTLFGAKKYVDGLVAYKAKNYELAISELEISKEIGTLHSDDLLNNAYNQATIEAWYKSNTVSAWELATKNNDDSSNPISLYNLGAIEWYLSKTDTQFEDVDWRTKLETVVKYEGVDVNVPASMFYLNQLILDGVYNPKPKVFIKPTLITEPLLQVQ